MKMVTDEIRGAIKELERGDYLQAYINYNRASGMLQVIYANKDKLGIGQEEMFDLEDEFNSLRRTMQKSENYLEVK